MKILKADDLEIRPGHISKSLSIEK